MALRSLNYISLCTGGGGLDLGFDLACERARPVCYVEREAFCASHLVAAIEQGLMAPAPLWSDVCTFNGRPWRGVVDFVIGGIPCQPHSQAGKRKGKDDERDLWADARRIIIQSGAWGVVIENVEGMLTTGGAERVVRDLERLGFLVKIGLFTASEVGCTHRRARVFILAINDRRRRAARALADARRDDDGRAHLAGDLQKASAADEGTACRTDGQRLRGRSGDGGEDMADAGGARSQRLRADAGTLGRQDAGRLSRLCGGTALGAADFERRREGRTEPALRNGNSAADGTGDAMENAARDDRKNNARSRQSGCGAPDAGRRGGDVANAGGRGRDGRPDGAGRGTQQRAFAEWTSLRLQPPGPNERDAWARIIADAPHLAPALSSIDGAEIAGLQALVSMGAAGASPEAESEFRRMADDVAARLDTDRIDRLRMLGNGVDPLEAAYALRTLGARLAADGCAAAAEFFVTDPAALAA